MGRAFFGCVTLLGEVTGGGAFEYPFEYPGTYYLVVNHGRDDAQAKVWIIFLRHSLYHMSLAQTFLLARSTEQPAVDKRLCTYLLQSDRVILAQKVCSISTFTARGSQSEYRYTQCSLGVPM